MQLVATRTLTTRLAAPVLTVSVASSTQLDLSWTAPTANGQSVIAGRRLYRATSASGPWTQLSPPTGTSASATGLTTGTTYYFYVEYYDQFQTGLPSNIASGVPVSPAVTKKWFPGWVVLLDNFMSNTAIRTLHLAPTFNQGSNSGHIIETASMPNVTGLKVLTYWGFLESGTTVENATYINFDVIQQYLDRCQQAGKKLMLSVFPIAFGGGNFHNGSIFPAYISENATTYGITEPLSYGSGAMARTWRPAVNERLILLHEAIAAAFDTHPAFGGCQTEETSINVANGVDGFSYAAYTVALKAQMVRMAAAFPRSQIRVSTNYFNDGDASGQDIIAYAAARGIGCGGPDVLPKETVAANRIFSGYTGGIDYRGVGPYGPGTGGANLTPWWAEIQTPEMGSGKEGDFTMQQLYDCAILGQANTGGTGGTGTNTTIAGMRPMNPNFFVIYRNTSTATAPATYRLNWYSDIKPFVNSHVGYGSNLYPINQPS